MTRRNGRIIAAAAFIGLLALPAHAQSEGQKPFDAEQTEAIETIVRDYLLKNPEIVMQAYRILQERVRIAEQQRMRETVVAMREELVNDPLTPVGGNPDGSVTVVEFFDYNCPYCKRSVPTLTKLLEQDKDIRLAYKEWPILGPASVFAARASLAASKQGKYDAFHHALMTAKGRLNNEKVLETARELGLDMDRLKQDMSAPEVDQAIAKNKALAKQLGINGTPAFVIGDAVVPGAADLTRLKALVKQARQES